MLAEPPSPGMSRAASRVVSAAGEVAEVPGDESLEPPGLRDLGSSFRASSASGRASARALVEEPAGAGEADPGVGRLELPRMVEPFLGLLRCPPSG